MVIADESSIKELVLGEQPLRSYIDNAISSQNGVLKKAEYWLNGYFNGKMPSPSELPLSPEGSAFSKKVWKMLCDIPYGSVVTYGDIAKKIAHERGIEKMSAQAVGGAVGRNPISIIIPCHRVVGTKGNLTGYGGGMKNKIWLLDHEGLDMNEFYVPKKSSAL